MICVNCYIKRARGLFYNLFIITGPILLLISTGTLSHIFGFNRETFSKIKRSEFAFLLMSSSFYYYNNQTDKLETLLRYKNQGRFNFVKNVLINFNP